MLSVQLEATADFRSTKYPMFLFFFFFFISGIPVLLEPKQCLSFFLFFSSAKCTSLGNLHFVPHNAEFIKVLKDTSKD